jgi:hypothetical protein
VSVTLSRLGKLGIAKETTAGTFVVPSMWLPYEKAEFDDQFTSIKDNSVRANDTNLQGVYQGVVHAEWSIDINAYPDVSGHVWRGILGPDTIVAGVSTTLSSATTVGATSISVTATIPVGSTIAIDTAGLVEYAVTGTPSGSGPFVIPIASPSGGLVKAHASGATVVSQTTHTFKQSPTTPRATYSLLVWDTVAWSSYSYACFSDVQIKVDPKAAVTLSTKLTSMPGVSATTATPTYTGLDPFLGWEWGQTNAGGASSRGLELDLTVKRQVEPVHSSDGIQAPREIFSGALDADGTLKAIFENTTDLQLYLTNTQQPAVATLTQPITKGGSILTLTMTQSAWTSGKRDLGSDYVQADYAISGVYNATDSGALSVTLSNFVTSAY